MRALALTDSGNLFGAIEFYKAALAHGVKPILGCELRVDGFPLVILAMNADGYRNLVALSSRECRAQPVDSSFLSEHASGLVALSGGAGGEIARKLLSGDERSAVKVLHQFRDLFGRENFFIELQDHGLGDEQKLMPLLTALSKKEAAPTVATNTALYLARKDSRIHEAMLAIRNHQLLSETDRTRMGSDEYYMKSPDEMLHRFAFDRESLRRTIEIADRVDLEFELNKPHLPAFPVAPNQTEESALDTLARNGLAARGFTSPEYQERLAKELAVIKGKHFSGYFLIVSDFIAEAKRRGMPVGPGRGSAAGSLVAYALGITEVDPLEHGLIFERFLNPERSSLPDIDVDICHRCRDEIIEYVRDRFGRDSVAQIITFGTFGAKAVLRDAARICEIHPAETERIVRLVPDILKMTLKDAVDKTPELQAARIKFPTLFEIALGLEGLVRHASRHAAGVVISNVPMTEIVPVYEDPQGHILTQYEMRSIESLGLLKIDILGLKTLTVIADAIRNHPSITIPKACDDPGVYKMLAAGHALGVFQLDSTGMRDLLLKVRPSVFGDLVALISLYRPGPMSLADDFVALKHGRKKSDFAHPLLEPILSGTYGIILYQEQVMAIAHRIGGYSLAEADDLRKAMAKKKHEMMHDHQERFIKGAIKSGMSEKDAAALFAKMERFAGYGFNKSHAVAYGVIAYRTAWLKVHHPEAFMAALLSHELDNRDKLALYINECRRMGLELKPPNVNSSGAFFSPAPKGLVYGMSAIKNVGVAAAEAIVAERSKGGFKDLPDFLARVGTRTVPLRAVEALISVGAFDGLGPNRRSMFESLAGMATSASSLERERNSGQISLFGDAGRPRAEEKTLPEWPDLATRETEFLGFSFARR